MKSLIQNNFAPTAINVRTASSPTRKQIMAIPDLKSVISDRGDPRMNSEKLRLLLPKIRFPQAYDEKA